MVVYQTVASSAKSPNQPRPLWFVPSQTCCPDSWLILPKAAVWLVTFLSILPGLLDLASPIAANAVFALTAVGKRFRLVFEI